MSSLISANNISVIRQEKSILHHVTLEIKEHDFITVIGPNGAGKSILLKVLSGFFPPDKGTITRKEGLKIGYVPQRFIADHTIPITVKRFLTLRKHYSRDVFDSVIDKTSVRELLGKPLHVMSGGELQRVLLARALLTEPDVLILDEPAQNLDVPGQLAFYKLLEQIYNEQNIAIVMVSHDLHLVMASTQQVVCLYHHICCSGEPHMVAKDPEFISLFGHDMAKMMAVYHHEHTHTHE